MRPFTDGMGIVAESSSGPAPNATVFASESMEIATGLIRRFMSFLSRDGKGPRKAESQLMDRFAADLRRANACVEGKPFARSPDRANQDRVGPRAVANALGERLGDRPHGPGEWSLEYGAEKESGLVLACTSDGRVEVNRGGVPALGSDSGDGKSGPTTVGRRQKDPVFSRDAWTAFLL